VNNPFHTYELSPRSALLIDAVSRPGAIQDAEDASPAAGHGWPIPVSDDYLFSGPSPAIRSPAYGLLAAIAR